LNNVNVNLTIYNALGQIVKRLVNEKKISGKYQVMWDGRDDRWVLVASGVYIYQLKAGDLQQSRKMILLK
jgi:flagellar hook assembly protein FlgD